VTAFDPSSRYYALATKTQTIIDADGEPRDVRYVERRILPPSGSSATLVEHAVAQGERLDQITARYLGDPTQFWRVADANDAVRPEELTDEIGRRVIIPLPHA
jgi:hypothetical protein